jgi:glycosyltransferase involved in cell wall biosynthesis
MARQERSMQDGTAPGHARLSVVIPHLNQPAYLARCLASLAAGTSAPDEVIVVDNGSRDLPAAVCAAHGARLLTEAEPGPGPTRNRGVAAATGDVLAFIDADCLADPGWLAEARAAMADPAATILGGDVRIALADPARMTMIEAYESVYAYRMDRYIAREGFTGTGNLVVRRAVLADVGPFAGIGVAEDRDWGRRATAKGYRIRFVPGMRAYHPARQRLAESFRKWDRQCAHDYADARARPGGRLRFALKTLAMPLSPLAELPRIIGSNRLAGPRARLLAFVALLRIRLYRAGVMARLLVSGGEDRMAGAWNRKA